MRMVIQLPGQEGGNIKSRGRLVYSESEKELQARRGLYNKVGNRIFFTGLLTIFLPIYLYAIIHVGFLNFTRTTVCVSIGFVLLISASMIVEASKYVRPMKVYTKGITMPYSRSRSGIFVRFDRINEVREGSDWIHGEYYRLVGKDPNFSVILSKDNEVIDKLVEFIEGRIRRLE